MPKRDSFIFYRSFEEALRELQPSEEIELRRAIADYSLDFMEPKLTGLPKVLWGLIFPNLKANNQRFLNGIKGGKHGDKGGRPTSKKPLKNPKKTPKVTPNKDIDKDIDKDKDVNVDDDIRVVFDFEKKLIEYGFEKKLISDWLKVRKKKKAVNTETALDGFISEVEKTLEDPNKIMRTCIERNWMGFKASWLEEKRKEKGFAQKEKKDSVLSGIEQINEVNQMLADDPSNHE
jgi:hypothetical protein